MERNENGLRVRIGEDNSRNRNFSCPGTGELWNGGQGNQMQNQTQGERGSCDAECSQKQLAMVYAPMQCWRMIYSPADALRHGTLFEELYKPLEGYGHE